MTLFSFFFLFFILSNKHALSGLVHPIIFICIFFFFHFPLFPHFEATGIPRAFLETVNESDLTDGSVALPGGGFAKVKTNENNFSELAVAAAVDFDNDASLNENYKCSICSGVLVSAVNVPCCGTSYCDKCVRKKLVTTNFSCPGCKTQISPDLLVPNRELRAEIEQAKRKKIAEVLSLRKEQKVCFFSVLFCLDEFRFLFLFYFFSFFFLFLANSGRRCR